jgi:hypothetical protein
VLFNPGTFLGGKDRQFKHTPLVSLAPFRTSENRSRLRLRLRYVIAAV